MFSIDNIELEFLIATIVATVIIILGGYKIIKQIIVNKKTRKEFVWGDIHEIKIFTEMLDKKNEAIYCLGGEFHHRFWANDLVITKIKGCLAKGVTFNLAGGPILDIQSEELLKLINKRKVTFYKLASRDSSHHFRVTYPNYDISYHSGLEGRSSKPTVFIWMNNEDLGKTLIGRFKKKTKELQPIEEGKLIDSVDFSKLDNETQTLATDEDKNALRESLKQDC